MKEDVKFYDGDDDEIVRRSPAEEFSEVVWWDKDVDVSFKMPSYLRVMVNNLLASIEYEHLEAFDYYLECVHIFAKQAAISGQITEYQCQVLLKSWGYKENA